MGIKYQTVWEKEIVIRTAQQGRDKLLANRKVSC